MNAETAILIVGAGPVGLTAALELARRGFRPRIIDRGKGPTPEHESRALGIHGRTIELLEASGVGGKILDEGNRVTHIDIRRNGRSVRSLDLSEYPCPHPFIVVLSQGRTERILEEALGEHDIAVEWRTQCTALRLDGGRPIATLEGTGTPETIEPDYVVGADGPGSMVREAAGIPFAGTRLEPQTFGLADAVLTEPVDPGRFVIDLLDDGALIRIPMTGNMVRFISNRPDIGATLPDDVSVAQIVWNSTFRISYRLVETFRNGPVFLMGDAAHIHSPAGGRGMNLGMEDAAWFAWAMEEGRLDSFSTDRLPIAEQTLKFSQTQTNRITGLSRYQATLIAALLPTLMRIPPVRRFALRNILAREIPAPPWLG